MKLELRHLSGSRAGEVESFDDSNAITVGRHPSSGVVFDPERDRAVSGHHASLSFEHGQWVLRDVGSSNGTYVDEQKVTEQVLRSGQIIQFGSNGPKVRVTLAGASPAPIGMTAPAVQAEGHTVMMMMPHDSGEPAGLSSTLTRKKKKKGGIGRALLIIGAVGAVVLLGLVALAFVIRNNNIRKLQQAQGTKTTTAVESTPTTQTATEAAAAVASTADAEELKRQIEATQQTMASAEQSLEKGEQNAGEIADLKRQIAESQALMEQMTQQLQQKNDEIAAERARANEKPKVVYVPVTPKASPAPLQPLQPAPVPSQSSPAPSVASTSPAAQRPAVVQVAETTTPPRPAPPAYSVPPVTNRSSAPPPSRPTPAISQPTAPAHVVSAPEPPPSAAPLYKNKSLKMKVSLSSVPPEIPPAGLPSGTDRGLVTLIGSALVSSGDYVVGTNGQANVSVMVTNYKAQTDRNVDTKKVVTSTSKIGKRLGLNLPGGGSPVDVKHVVYDAALSARVRLLDRTGRILLEAEPNSASKDRTKKVAVAGVGFNDAAASDTAVGDVARRVVADAVDALRSGLSAMDWSTQVANATKDHVILGVGSSANVEPGDVFEIVDSQQRPLTRVRVTSVTEGSSEAVFLTDPGKAKVASMMARYLGSESSSAPRLSARTITTRAKTPVFDGPGTSFRQIKELKPGVRMKLEFTVGPWGKAQDGGATIWVPLANVTIGS